MFDGLKRAAARVRARHDARAEQCDIVQRYAYQHRKDLLALLRTSLGEVRVFPLVIVRMERGQPFELRPVSDVSAFVEQVDRRRKETDGVVVVVAGPNFRWRLTPPPLPGGHQQLAVAAQQFAAAVTTAGRSSDDSGTPMVPGARNYGHRVDVGADPRQPA